MTEIQFRSAAVLLIAASCLLACMAFASIIVLRNYKAARSLVAAGPPSPFLKSPGDTNLAGLQSVTFQSSGLRMAGWYVPSKNGAAVVVTHGTYSDRGAMLPEIRLLAAAGFGVLAFDWPGLGESQGSIRWDAQAQNALRAAIDWIAARPEVDHGRIGGLGFSIGGVILTQVAAQDHRLRAVVIESAASDFHTYVDFRFSNWSFLSRWSARWALRGSGLFVDADSAVRRIGQIAPRPVFIIGQTGDQNVPASMVQELESAAGQPKQLWLIPGDHHGNYQAVAGEQYGQRLQDFFRENLGDAAVTPVNPR